MQGLAVALCLGLLATAAASPATAAAGDASAVAARVSLSGTVLTIPVTLLDQTLSEAAVSQGDADQTVTDNLLELELPLLGDVPVVSATLVESTASSDFVRAEASSFLTDVSVNLGLDALPLPIPELGEVLALDAIATHALCPVVGTPVATVEPPVTVTLLGQPIDIELDEEIEVEIPGVATAVILIAQTEVTTDTALAVGLQLTLDVNVLGLVTLDLDVTLSESKCERGLAQTNIFAPVDIDVDYQEAVSDANRVFEPGETVDVAPVWNNTAPNLSPALGDASNFTGPAGPDYTIALDAADYGVVGAGADASCKATGVCYQMETGPLGVSRPAQHWDTTFVEDLTDGSTYTWTLHIGDSFPDTPRPNPFYRFVETIWHNGITLGCNDTDYCPGAPNARQQMAVFVLRSMEGSDYVPAACDAGDPMFDDVAASSPFCGWVEELAGRGIATGCGGNDFCPGAPITRAQMSTFLLRGMLGAGYTPPTCSGTFDDVPCPSQFANWIEDLFARGITEGCDEPNGYCPSEPVTRGQMAVFLTRTFGLQLYGL